MSIRRLLGPWRPLGFSLTIPPVTRLASSTAVRTDETGLYGTQGKTARIPPLVQTLQPGRLAGCALEIFPSDPSTNGSPFDDSFNSWVSAPYSLSNVVLTPRIGGSTEKRSQSLPLGTSTPRSISMRSPPSREATLTFVTFTKPSTSNSSPLVARSHL